MNTTLKKWVGIVTGALCLITSTAAADEAVIADVENTDTPAVLDDNQRDEQDQDQSQTPKQVGKASEDATNTAKSSNVAKYVLAASAVVIGVAAIILVSRHHGHRSGSHSH